ncbi:MAG: PH domain-containing protein [Pseudomonadota bacterium]
MIESDTAVKTEHRYANWTRAEPIALAYFFVSIVYIFATNFLIYLIPVVVLQRETLTANGAFVGVLTSVLIVFFAVLALIKFWFYQFKLGENRIEIKQGIFKKSHLDLPFEKIQNVKIEQPLYYRLNQYAMVELETAGSVGSEARIVAMNLEEAHTFKTQVMLFQKEAPAINKADTQESTLESNKEVLLNTRTITDLIIHGITNNRVWIFFGAAAPFYNTFVDSFSQILTIVGFDITQYLDYASLSLAMFLLHVLSLFMFTMLLLVAFSVIASLFVFYKFRLSRLDDKYIRRSGLINKQEISLKKSRIQHAVQQQDWLDIIINRANLKLAQNSAGLPGDQTSLNSTNKLVVPSITPRQSNSLIEDVFNFNGINEVAFLPVSKRIIMRYLLFPILPILIVLLAIVLSVQATLGIWFGYITICIVLVSLAIVRWYRWGYFIKGDHIVIRKGLFGKDIHIFNRHKTQQIKLAQTIFMRKYKKASVRFVLASSAHLIPYIDDQIALSMLDETLLTLERDKPAWM